MQKIIIVVAFLALCLNSKAEGYQVNAQSHKNIAMGHTGTGLSLGASSVHFNPGALGLMEKKYDFSLGGILVLSDVAFSKQNSTYQANTESPTGTPFYFYGAAKLNDKFVASLGVTTPYGNSLAWNKEWDGRYLIQDISLKAIVAQPTLSYKISDKLGFGIGAMIVYGAVDLNRALPVQNGNEEGSVNLSGSTVSLGFNTGLYYKVSDAFSLGLNYRSKVAMKMEDGDADFNVPASLSASFPAGNKFDAELPLPANLTLGAGFKVNDKLTLACDLQYVFWNAYDELVFDFEMNTPQLADSRNPREYENTLIYRLGAQYTFTDKLTVRAGVYYDETPISDNYLNPETPGMNKVGLSIGGSFNINDKLSVDASLLYIYGIEREAGYEPANFYGTYNSQAFLPGIGFSYSF
ncbi:OmpP1/FadL family transporter [Plebeiibacterium sediminum]|uniref:Outer membrane protein transport protein n=1 Tax=Plebeiibacterium sediminum TaxID=2992112 RepID=A0AAE3SFV6_9BACT|nr:outer membrane protein transport protein [Plebeiobacterium sediminum]MCW3787845.1 outer membrane protein transport protein [Plebeiobacterium sediminum]